MSSKHLGRYLSHCITFGFVLGAVALGIGRMPAVAADPQDAPLALDRDTAMWLVTLPLSCVDKLHEPPRSRGYLYEASVTLKPDFFKTRAFYGCTDWHSAVNSTWTLVKVLRMFPDMPTARLIRDKLNEHLAADAIKGEIAFFNEEGNKAFERPYGWAWVLRLYGELRSWQDPDAQKWATNVEPLAKLLLERTVPYLKTLAAPLRIGTHQNTAYALRLLLEYARATDEKPLEQAVLERSRQFFAADFGCAPNVEVSGSDFFSPCLTEAALMAEVLPAAEFSKWLDGFLPRPNAPAFKTVATVVEMQGTPEELKKLDMEGAKAHLIGLAVGRANALEVIAAGLPPGDSRIAAYRTLATSLARSSIKAMYDAGYAGTHWIATYIVDYLISAHGEPATK
jgi:hypothetical protein